MNEHYNDLLTNEEQEQLYPLNEDIKRKWQTWVPKGYEITNMQIYDAMSRGIPIPNGNPEHDSEYIQFLSEHVLSVKKEPIITAPPLDDDKTKKKEFEKTGGLGFAGFFKGLFKKDKNKKVEEDQKYNPKKIDGTFDKQPENIDPKIGVEPIDKQPISQDPNGVEPSISQPEIEEALNKYLSENKENTLVKIVARFKSFVLPFLLAAIMALMLTMIKHTDTQTITTINKQEIINNTLEYVLSHEEYKDYEEALKEAMDNIAIGDQIELSDGQKFNTISNMQGTTKELGKEFNDEHKFAGKYPITGFSMIRKSDNKIIAYIEDFYTPANDTKLSTFVDESLAKNNLNFDDVELEFHFGRTDRQAGERSRLGWLEDGNVVLDEDAIRKSIEETITHNGTIEKFQGDHITITTDSGEVQIPVKDENGNFYKPGDKVIGSDNNIYEIDGLSLTEKKEYTEEQVKEEIPGGLNFSIKNAKLAAALPFIIAAILDYIIKKKMNQKAEKNPYYRLIPNDKLPEYLDEFHEGKTKFYKEHNGTIYDEALYTKLIMEGYFEITGEKVESIDELNFEVSEGQILVYKKDKPEKVIDLASYIAKKAGDSIGNGWDEEAEEYFKDGKGGR